MMTKKEFKAHSKKFFLTSLVMLLLMVVALVGASVLDKRWLSDFLVGALIALAISAINLSAIGVTIWALLVKDFTKWVALVPIASFLGMILVAIAVVFYWPASILGFALGLASPLLYGGIAAFSDKPA